MKKLKNRRWIFWTAVPAAIAGFLGLLSLPFVIDEPPPDDAHLRPVRREVPRERNGFFAVNLTMEEADALVEREPGEEEISEEEREKEDACVPFTEGWDLELAERILKKKRLLLERFDESLRYPEFQVPEIEQVDSLMPYLVSLRRCALLAMLRAASLFERENELQAFQEALKVIQFGHRLHGADGTFITFMEGRQRKLSGLACLAHFIERTKLEDREVQTVLDGLPGFDEKGWKSLMRREYLVMANAADRMACGESLDDLKWLGLISWRPFFKPQQTKRLLGEVIKILIDSPYLQPVAEKKILWAKTWERIRGPRWFPTNYSGKVYLECLCVSFEGAFLHHLASDEFYLLAPKLLFALKRFHRDRGALPVSLDELVPAYLKEIPRDPFDGEKLRYDKGRKIVWTAGLDLNFSGFRVSEESGIVDGPALRIGF